MPTYEYRCTACKHGFEVFHSIKDSPKRKCPQCGKNTLERVIGTGGAVIFKGSGFYQTDYRSESYKKAVEADKPKDGGESKSSDTKTESKADSKPEPKPEKKPEPKAAEPKPTKPKEKKSKSEA
jgi:putative FmdB family regulatory protein